MSTRIRFGLCLLAALVPLARPLGADDPPAAGRVLILENERTLEGDVRRHGDLYCVKRSVGETWVPAEKVLCLCGTHEEAYQFLRARANLADPDERLRLARWCQRYNLRDQALDEANQAVRLRPNHAES